MAKELTLIGVNAISLIDSVRPHAATLESLTIMSPVNSIEHAFEIIRNNCPNLKSLTLVSVELTHELDYLCRTMFRRLESFHCMNCVPEYAQRNLVEEHRMQREIIRQ